MMTSEFLDALLEDNASYWLARDLEKTYSGIEEISVIKRGCFISSLLNHPSAKNILLSLKKIGSLKLFLPHLDALYSIPQRKSKSRNVFEHTLAVIDKTPFDSHVFRWSALLHDYGKFDTYKKNKSFRVHEVYSYRRAIKILQKHRIHCNTHIETIVLYHMYPLEYQRNPVWKDSSVRKFVDRCGGEDAIGVVQFSIYDKQAEHNNKEYVKPLIELKERVIGIINADRLASNRREISTAS